MLRPMETILMKLGNLNFDLTLTDESLYRPGTAGVEYMP